MSRKTKPKSNYGFRKPSKYSRKYVLAFIFSGVVAGLAAGYLIFAASNPVPLPVYPVPTIAYSYDQAGFYGVNFPNNDMPDFRGTTGDVAAQQVTSQIKSTGSGWLRTDASTNLSRAFLQNSQCGNALCDVNKLPNINVLAAIDHVSVSNAPLYCPTSYVFSWPPGTVNPNFSLNDWQQVVDCVSKTFKGKIKAYEIWNEPTVTGAGFQFGYQNGTASHYFDMLRVAYQTIKANDPSATVIGLGGALVYSGTDPTLLNLSTTFARQLASMGAGQYMDAISLHPYPWTDINGTVLSEYIKNWNIYTSLFNKPVWVTETGQYTNVGNQSNYLSYAYGLFINQNASRIFWYRLKDGTDGPIGLYDISNNARPSASYMSYYATTPKSGLLRVQTNPAAQVTITLKPTNNPSASTYTAQWGIAWPRFEKGAYNISFTYPSTTFNGQPVKLPPPQTIMVKAKMTTVITVDITNGGFTTQYFWE